MERSREQVLAERKRRKADKLSKKKGMASSIEKKLEDGHPSLCIAADVDSVTPTCNYSGKIVSGSELTKMTNELDESLVTLKLNHLTLNESNENGKAKSVILTGSTSKGPAEDGSTRTKAQLRAERRAKQDAQRVAKAAKKKRVQDKVESEEKLREDTVMIEPKAVNDDKNVSTNNMHRIKLFSHLYRESSIEDTKILMTSTTPIHKSVIKLGVQYRNKIVVGSNARVVALLNTLKQVLSDYKTPAEKDFSRGFEIVLASTTTYLEACRPISVSMFNALKHLKWLLSQLPNTVSDNEAQNKLREAIDDYIKEQIDMAGKAICIMVQKKISEGDVILTFGHSSLIERILIETLQVGITFRVIIVDAGPLYEGKELLRRLSRHGLNCVYVLLSATSYIMREASKVLLGAHALLTNGYVMSRAGSSQVALIAKSYNVPVLVCCETHKFSERVQTDAFVYNEMGDPEEFMDGNIWKCNNYLTPLTLMYDVTPSDLVTAVVTELAVLPCTSVPVVLRVKPANTTL